MPKEPVITTSKINKYHDNYTKSEKEFAEKLNLIQKKKSLKPSE